MNNLNVGISARKVIKWKKTRLGVKDMPASMTYTDIPLFGKCLPIEHLSVWSASSSSGLEQSYRWGNFGVV